MPEDLNKSVTSLSEDMKRFEIASYYTHGDAEMAKQMMAGSYKDVYAIKARFASATLYGAFLTFFNYQMGSLASTYVILSNSFYVNDIKTNVDWRIFEKDLSEKLATNQHDEVMERMFKDTLAGGFNMQFIQNLKRLLEIKDEISINRTFQKFLQDKYSWQNVHVSVDCEQISSLDMELDSISSKKIDFVELARKKQEEAAKKADVAVELEDDESNVLEGKDIKLVLEGSVVLSPMKGKEIGTVVAGDQIRVGLYDRNPKAVQIAKAFKAYEDGRILPITGRVISAQRRAKGGYRLYTIIAKGIYVKIDEEEENIKIAMEKSVQEKGSAATESSSKVTAIVLGVVAVIVVIIAIVLAVVLS